MTRLPGGMMSIGRVADSTNRSQCQILMLLVLTGITIGCGGNTPANNSQPVLQSIAVSPDPATTTIPLGATQQFTATGTFSDGNSRDLTTQVSWTSSDTTIISITAGGLATAQKTGTAMIKASSGAISSQAANPATVGPAAVVSIAVSPNPATVAVGSTLQLTATATMSDHSTQNISATATWHSDNTAAATIDGTGMVTGVAKGSTNVIASAPGANQTVTSPASPLTVTAVLLSIDVAPTSVSVPLGNTKQFSATGHYNDGSTADLTIAVNWASSKTSIASISAVGLASTIGEGDTNITGSSGEVVSNTAVLTVTAPVLKSIAVAPNNPSIAVSGTQQFTATGTLTNDTTTDLTGSATWSSADTAVATIAAGGLATGVSAGSSTIWATDVPSGIKGSTTLTVGSGNGDSKLNGNYTFRFQSPGSLAGTEPYVAGVFTADGAGNLTNGILDLNPGGGGTLSTGVTFTGAYSIGSDGRGTISLTSMNPPYSFTGKLAVVSNGYAYVMETDGNGLGYGDIQLNFPGPFNNSSVNGPYVFVMGTAGTGIVGQFTADGSGHIPDGIVDINSWGTVSNATMSGTYNITDAVRGRGTATMTINTNPTTVIDLQLYVGRGSLTMVNTDTEQAMRAAAHPQTDSPFSNGSLAGDYVVTGGSDLESFGGQFTANGSGEWANGLLDLFTPDGTNFGVPFTATYAVADAAHGRFTATDTPQGVSSGNIVFYTVSNGLAVLVDLSSGNGATGEFSSSFGGPYNTSSLNGSYSFALQGCPLTGNDCTGEYTQTGVFTADGNGNVTLSVDTNNDGSVSTQTLVSGSYVVGDSGSDGGLITTTAGKIRFRFVDTTFMYLEDGASAPTRRVIGSAIKQN